MEKVFDWCVTLLDYCARRLSMLYRELSVWLLVMSVITLILAFLNRYLWNELRRARTAAREYTDSNFRALARPDRSTSMYLDRRLPISGVLTANTGVLMTLSVVYPPFNKALEASLPETRTSSELR